MTADKTPGDTAVASDGDLALATRTGLPDDLRLLVARYPREVWTGHANLGEMASFWLSRHAMFRELGTMLEDAAGRYREGGMDSRAFAEFFAPRLQFFLQQLHAHHHIEDDHYFPIFRRADARLVRGFEMLEGDHDALAASIQDSVDAANDFLRALGGAAGNIQPAADRYMQRGAVLIRGLTRHLDDEEDLIVPLILDRGELALGVGH
jgi:hemerythrin-like domain-containing protein